MNQKYIVKFEYGYLEQVYKYDERDFIIRNIDDIIRAINPEMLEQVEKSFETMVIAFGQAAKEL